MHNIKSQIITYAKSLGIDAIGFTSPEIPQQDLSNYQEYLKAKNYGNMLWMESRALLRENPINLFPQTKTVIVLGVNYYNEKEDTDYKDKDYKISIYANQLEDYHKWFYSKIKDLSSWLEQNFNSSQRYFVDSAPILEKVLAKKTTIGWQGKHTCIVSKDFGSWLFLGVLLTSLPLEEDVPHKDFCGSCVKCLKACPTGALSEYKLDTKKCISYLTIEHKDKIETQLQQKFNGYIFGCDECLRACHFNKWQKKSSHVQVQNNPNFPKELLDFLKLKSADFVAIFKNTAIKRTGYKFILQNVLINLINLESEENIISKEDVFKYIVPFTSYPDLEIVNLSSKLLQVWLKKM